MPYTVAIELVRRNAKIRLVRWGGHVRPIAIDLFSGVGGLSLGFEQAGFDVVASVEYDPIHAAVHKYNFPNTAMLCADIGNEDLVNAETILAAAREGLRGHGRDVDAWDQQIDVVFGGPPCQGFSTIGKRNVLDDRNNLVFHFARLVEALNPRYFVMENVPGMAAGAHGQILSSLVERLRNAGYTVHDPELLNAKNFGVPQDRKRVILIGSRNDCAVAEYPMHLVTPVSKVGQRVAGRLPQGPSVWDALRDLPNVDRRRSLFGTDEFRITSRELAHLEGKASAYSARLREIVIDPSDLSYDREWDRKLFANSMLTFHEPNVIHRFHNTPKGTVEETSRFYRLHPNGLSSTLRAGTGSERGAYTSPRPIHPYRARVITVREAARLHSFPDWFRFHRTKWHGFRQIGNSVPPLLGRAIGKAIVTALGIELHAPDRIMRFGNVELLEMDYSAAARHFGRPEKRESHYRRTHGAPPSKRTAKKPKIAA